MQEVFGTQFTDMILQAEEGGGPLSQETDQELRLERCCHKDRAPGVADIAWMVEWERLWMRDPSASNR